MSVLVRNGRIVTAADDYRADLFIQGETVASSDGTSSCPRTGSSTRPESS